MSIKLFRRLAALSGIIGIILLGISFAINSGSPPANATAAQLMAFAKQNFTSIFWGAWMQAIGPLLIMLFAFALVSLAGAATRLAGWMTLFGGTILMMVSLIEITFYIGALYATTTGFVSLDLIHAVQHLYFIVAAPSLFLPLGVVLLGSAVLPRVFGYLALVLGASFAILGVVFLTTLTLPALVLAGPPAIEALWWNWPGHSVGPGQVPSQLTGIGISLRNRWGQYFHVLTHPSVRTFGDEKCKASLASSSRS